MYIDSVNMGSFREVFAAMSNDTSPPNARQRSQQETRQRIREAAARLFAEHGSAATRTADIAAAAGVAVGTVYLHFKDKDALLKNLLDTALAGLRQQSQKVTVADDAPGREQVTARMTALSEFVLAEPDLAAILFDPTHLASAPGQQTIDFLVQSQEKGLFEGIAAGYYRGDLSATLVSRAMVGILIQVLGWWARHPDQATRQDVIDVLVELRLKGLNPR